MEIFMGCGRVGEWTGGGTGLEEGRWDCLRAPGEDAGAPPWEATKTLEYGVVLVFLRALSASRGPGHQVRPNFGPFHFCNMGCNIFCAYKI